MAQFGSEEFYELLPKKRMAAGVLLFNTLGLLLIVRTIDRHTWSLPGGVIEQDESPRLAAIRELKEELDLSIADLRLVCVHHTSRALAKTESIQFVFAGGVLADSVIARIKPQAEEIAAYRFVEESEAMSLGDQNLRLRLPRCLAAARTGTTAYLES